MDKISGTYSTSHQRHHSEQTHRGRVVAYGCNPSTGETEVVKGHLVLHGKTLPKQIKRERRRG